MFSKIKKALVYLAIMALTIQSSMALTFLNPEKTKAQTPDKVLINEIMADPTTGNSEWVELYNAGDNDVDVNGYSLTSIGGIIYTVTVPTTITSHGYLQLELVGSKLVNSGDDVTLNNGFEDIDQVKYGNNPYTNMMSASQKGKTIGRVDDGENEWYVNLEPTPGLSNDLLTSELPARIVSAHVPETVNNPVDTINSNNVNNVTTEFTYEKTLTEETTQTIFANLNKVITSNDTSAFDDGTIYLYGKTILNGISSEYLPIISYESFSAGQAIVKDTIIPTGTIIINDSALVTNSLSVSLSLSSSDEEEMIIANTNDFIGSTWEKYDASKPWTLTSGNGEKTIYTKFRDTAGNVSATSSAKIYYNQDTGNIVNSPIIGDGQLHTINPVAGLELDVKSSINTNLTTATYSQNPGSSLPTGITAFGRYFEMDVNDAQKAITWPIQIRIYYTEQDLVNANVTDENQLLGLYYYDSEIDTWKLYDDTGVNTNGYAGYIWANADHFTPVVAGIDITAPEKPANFTATAKDGEMELKWDKVEGASGYYVRYREGTSIDNKEYSTIYINGADNLNTKVTGLTNNNLYEFGVRAIDMVGNLSDWAVVVSSPISTVTLAKAETITPVTSYQAQAATDEEQSSANGETEITTVGPDEGQVKSESAFSWSRFWITLAILLIAAGAAYGGYYGYQWWMERPKKTKKNSTPKPPTNTTDKTDKTGRW